MFENFDGTGRKPREQQLEALRWLEENWDKYKVFGIQGSCGIGKQAIARAVQLETNAAYITTENMLVQQALKTYPEANYLIGRSNYKCSTYPNLSCEDIALSKVKHHCTGCKYQDARKRALSMESTIYNPISYYYLAQSKKWVIPKVLIVDEAHKLGSSMMLLSGESFSIAKYNIRPNMSLIEVTEWLAEQEAKFRLLIAKAPFEKSVYYSTLLHKARRVRQCLLTEPHKYVILYDEGKLHIKPIYPPKEIKSKILSSSKLILMSATLFRSDIESLVDGPYGYLDLSSPIDKDRRKVILDPIALNINYKTSPEVIAAWVKKVLRENPNKNTIVHVSYGWSKKLAPLLPGVLTNTKDTKRSVLKKFKKHGGVWLASGCAEGIDLLGDICRLNVIPILPRANIEDPIVRKRLSLPGGEVEYELDILRTVIQQAGRSTRDPSDHSKTVVGDIHLKRLISKYKDSLPSSFVESLEGV